VVSVTDPFGRILGFLEMLPSYKISIAKIIERVFGCDTTLH
jgi:hypothetical protein